jgi:hypothetical protein
MLFCGGEFIPWLKREFDWCVRTAACYMRLALLFAGGTKLAAAANLTNVTQGAWLELSKPDVSQEALDEVIAQAQTGQKVDKVGAQLVVAKRYKVPRVE